MTAADQGPGAESVAQAIDDPLTLAGPGFGIRKQRDGAGATVDEIRQPHADQAIAGPVGFGGEQVARLTIQSMGCLRGVRERAAPGDDPEVGVTQFENHGPTGERFGAGEPRYPLAQWLQAIFQIGQFAEVFEKGRLGADAFAVLRRIDAASPFASRQPC